jgi:tartronate-semialdehyde synthase
MGTEIDNIVEFEEILDLPVDDEPTSLHATPPGELQPA